MQPMRCGLSGRRSLSFDRHAVTQAARNEALGHQQTTRISTIRSLLHQRDWHVLGSEVVCCGLCFACFSPSIAYVLGRINDGEQLGEVVVCDSQSLHVEVSVRVDDLIAQRAEHEVWLLRHEEDLLLARHGQHAAVKRPQATDDAK